MGRAWSFFGHEQGLGASYEEVASANKGIMALFQGAHHSNHYPKHTYTSPNYRPNYILCMLRDKDQNLWMGTWGGGLSLFDIKTKTFRNFTTEVGLPGNFILALKEDTRGDLWIGTNKGLSHFDGKTFTNYGKINGLTSDFIFSLEFSNDHSFWLGGHYGLNRLYLNPETRKLRIIE